MSEIHEFHGAINGNENTFEMKVLAYEPLSAKAARALVDLGVNMTKGDLAKLRLPEGATYDCATPIQANCSRLTVWYYPEGDAFGKPFDLLYDKLD